MAEWRIGGGWTDDELAPRLAEAARLPASLPQDRSELTLANGWNHVRSYAVVAHEHPGAPSTTGAFAHAKTLVSRFAFSDARIVVGHYRKNAHLRGRTMLLELKSLGLRFLCPVRIAEVCSESSDSQTLFGYRFDTLLGHVERGQEWFLLRKDHASGEISFRIEAHWREGEFPGLWAWAGFALLGRRYQRAWHRLAHAHLREGVLRWQEEDRRARGFAPVHLPALAPVQFFAQRALRRGPVAHEAEHVSKKSRLETLATGGAGVLLAAAAVLGAGLLTHRWKRLA